MAKKKCSKEYTTEFIKNCKNNIIHYYTKNDDNPLPKFLDENLKQKIEESRHKKKLIDYYTTNFDEPLPENLDENLKQKIEESRHEKKLIDYYTTNFDEPLPENLDENLKTQITQIKEIQDKYEKINNYLKSKQPRCRTVTNKPQYEVLLNDFINKLTNEEDKQDVSKLIKNIIRYTVNGKQIFMWNSELKSDDFKKVIELIESYISNQLNANKPIIDYIECLHEGLVYQYNELNTTDIWRKQSNHMGDDNRVKGGRKSRKRSYQIKKKKRRTRTTRRYTRL